MLVGVKSNDKKKLKRRLIRFAGSILSLAVLTYIAVSLITGSHTGFTRIFGIFSSGGNVELADEYAFDVGRNRVFADMDGSIAAAGTQGIQVLDGRGSEQLRDPFRMATPVIDARGGHAIAFDLGGTSARIFNKTEILASLETEGAIVSASVNRNGWVAVCTQASGAHRGVVTAYNNKGEAVYVVRLATGYVLSSVLSPDNRALAILNMTEVGSRITYYNLNSEIVDRAFDMPSKLILDLQYLQSGEVFAITTESLIVVGKDNESVEVLGYGGRRLGGYAQSDDYIVLYLLDYNVGHSGQLVTIGENKSVRGAIMIDREILSMSSGSEALAVLKSDGLALYSSALDEILTDAPTGSAAGATGVLVLGSGRTLLVSDHFAAAVNY